VVVVAAVVLVDMAEAATAAVAAVVMEAAEAVATEVAAAEVAADVAVAGAIKVAAVAGLGTTSSTLRSLTTTPCLLAKKAPMAKDFPSAKVLPMVLHRKFH
jgi:hypothetical protein